MEKTKKVYQKPELVDLCMSSVTAVWCKGGGGASDYIRCNNGSGGENR